MQIPLIESKNWRTRSVRDIRNFTQPCFTTYVPPVHLKSRLYENQEALPCTSSPSRPPASTYMSDLVAQSRCITQPEDAMVSLLPVSMSMANNTSSHAMTGLRHQYGISESYAPNCPSGPNLESFMDLLFLGWNPDLPDPAVMNH